MSAARFNEHLSPLKPGDKLGQAVAVQRLNSLATLAKEAAMGSNVRGGPGIRVRSGPQGVTISNSKLGGGAKKPDHPWRVRRAGDELFTLTSGHVNSLIPEDMTTEFEAVEEGLFVWIQADLDGEGAPTAVKLRSGLEPPAAEAGWFSALAPPTVAYYPLAKVTYISDGDGALIIEQMERLNLWVSRHAVEVGCALSRYQIKWETV